MKKREQHEDHALIGHLSGIITELHKPLQENWRSGPYHISNTLGVKPLDNGTSIIGTFLLENERNQRKYILRQIIKKGQSAINSIKREIQVLKTINKHPGIAGLIASGSGADFPWLMREYVDAPKLSRDTVKNLGYRETLTLFEKICRTVAHLHSLGITHGDIEPSNIILDKGSPVLIGFGRSEISKRVNRNDGLYTKVNTYNDLCAVGKLYGWLFSEKKRYKK